MKSIQNIYCVGRNYALHAKELNNNIPTTPMIFSKPTHAAVEANGQEVHLPSGQGSIHYEVELVIHIGKEYEEGMLVDDLVDEMAVGIDFTLRDIQTELKKNGHPWLLAKGFPNSALLSSFIPFPGITECHITDFALLINDKQVQLGNCKDMIFDLQTIVDYIAKYYGLGKGDIIFTGTPEGVGAIIDEDRICLTWGEMVVGDCKIKLGKI